MANSPGAAQAPAVEERVLEQHRQIHALAAEIEQTVELLELVPRLRELRALLVEHFLVEEEPGGFYDSIRALTPRLVGWVDQLQKEHHALLETVDRLSQQSAGLVTLVDTVLAEARGLTRRLAKHEAAEEAVLNETVNTDLGLGE